MTTEPESPVRDPALDAAWRAHSREEPPAQLDAAILTAAHRAVAEGAREARRVAPGAAFPRRWWMPLATAATIAGVVVGVWRLAPQEQARTAPSASDLPAPAAAPPSDPLHFEAGDATTPGREAGIAAERSAEAERSADAPAAGAAAHSLPPRATAPSGGFARSPAERGAVTAPAAEARGEDSASGSARADQRLAPPGFAAPPPSLPRAEASRPPTAKAAARSNAQAASTADVDARIARIRDLHEQGKLTEAAKELDALRAAVSDADRLLPPELREWAETVKPR